MRAQGWITAIVLGALFALPAGTRAQAASARSKTVRKDTTADTELAQAAARHARPLSTSDLARAKEVFEQLARGRDRALSSLGASAPEVADALGRLHRLSRKRDSIHHVDVAMLAGRLAESEARALQRGYQLVLAWKRDGQLGTPRALRSVNSDSLRRLSRTDVPAPERQRILRTAYHELGRRLSSFGADGEIRAALGEIGRAIGAGAAPAAGAEPELSIREQDRRIARAIQALLEVGSLDTPTRRALIRGLAQHGDEDAAPLLERVVAQEPALASVAERAMASIARDAHMTIVMASMEAKPYTATGGLANVAQELPRALARMGHRAILVMPRHAVIDRDQLHDLGIKVTVDAPSGRDQVSLYYQHVDGVHVIFLDNPRFFSDGRKGIYGDAPGRDYGDNALRYDFFGAAVPAALRALRERAPQILDRAPDILEIADAHAASATALARSGEHAEFFAPTRIVLGVHNAGAAYQQRFDASQVAGLTRPDLYYPMGPWELNGQVNFLKFAMVHADAVILRSRQYLKEMLTEAHGEGLHGVLQQRHGQGRVFGNLNAVDYQVWDPATDPMLRYHYSLTDPDGRSFDPPGGKRTTKLDVQARLGLRVSATAPLVIAVTRMDKQKGIPDVLATARDSIATGHDTQFVISGDGDPKLIDAVKDLAAQHPDRVAYRPFSRQLEHELYAASDFNAMPSLFEPSGLPQLYSPRYLSVPIVRRVGGLEESVEQWDAVRKSGWGFKFYGDLRDGMESALRWYHSGPGYRQALWRNGALVDFSWERTSAAEQVAIYRRILRWPPHTNPTP
jgi:starch synthase